MKGIDVVKENLAKIKSTKILITKEGVKVDYTLELPLIGENDISITIEPIANVVTFKEPLTIKGLKYYKSLKGNIISIELIMAEEKPTEIKPVNLVGKIVELRKKGLSYSKIAGKLNLTPSRVAKIFLGYVALKKCVKLRTFRFVDRDYVVLRAPDKTIKLVRVTDGIPFIVYANVDRNAIESMRRRKAVPTIVLEALEKMIS